ncbi:aldose 1-epimerase family protein [Flavihumibacter solisilvae]|uniref:Aldose epimerase n=1 Tax=Flavihumibacter solisilvae TaxID=1349421 RepID=A0A0C1IW45_9BACT|nr:aldose 1-epimerase family protein [Flavihumibacter solisilvae]KIC94704.1 aldose epimerase [Flavihumibacter solisilvae]
MIQLKNDHLIASIHPKGAELQELINPATQVNYMWSGDPAWWGKFSPVLFPIVGTLKDNTYIFNGQQYSLPRHGFARDRTFLAEQISETAALFTLQDDSETRAVYPFAFSLALHYQLDDDQLTCKYIVNNRSDNTMWFSIGAHPAFAVPLLKYRDEAKYTDHYLVFDRSNQLVRYKLKDGLISDETETVTLDHGKLRLNEELFREDALVLKGLPDSEIRIECSNHPHGLSFRWEDFPYFGIWATAGAGFVCLEPWCGIADNIHHEQQLEQKEGIQSLAPGEEWTRQWSVRCF